MSTGNTLIVKRKLPASRARVFAAWTQAETLQLWFCPDKGMTVPLADIDARDGGHYRIVMQNKDGETFSPSGTYEKVLPDEKLVFSWKWADSDLVTKVTIDLAELGENETELTLTHEGFPESEIRDKHDQGWAGCLDRLETHLH